MVYSVVISRETMRGRQDNLSVLAVTSVWLILSVCVTGIETTACTDQTNRDSFNHVTPMCKGGILYNTRVVIDTWGTGGPDVYSCTCTVTLGTKSASDTTRVTVQEYPGVEPTPYCASKLRITSTISTAFTEIGCNLIPATKADKFGTTEILTLTLSRAENSTPWQSGHCILILSDSVSSMDINVACQKANGTNPQTTIPTSTEDITPTTIKSRETITPTQSIDTTTTIQSRETTLHSITNSGCSTQGQVCQQQQGYTLTAVVVPLVVTILLISLSVVGHVVLYRRRLGLIKQSEYSGEVTSKPSTYDSLDLSNVEPPNLYSDTSTGQIYVNTTMES